VLPLPYLHGLSSSDFVRALTELLGSAVGLSASVSCRLASQWQTERQAFAQRDLSEVDYVYCWADGVHFSIRLGEQGRLCCLVIVGVRADGRKELVAVADGTRESTEDWAELLRDLRRRGMGRRWCWSAMGRWGCGGRCGRSSRHPRAEMLGPQPSLACSHRYSSKTSHSPAATRIKPDSSMAVSTTTSAWSQSPNAPNCSWSRSAERTAASSSPSPPSSTRPPSQAQPLKDWRNGAPSHLSKIQLPDAS
jgi:hypothetical protein